MFTSDDFGLVTDNDDDFSEDIYSMNDFDSEDDVALVDYDGDGIDDTIIQGLDTDDDGQIDTWGVATDLDNDGFADQVGFMEDSDGDGQIDTWAVTRDLDSDGEFDTVEIAMDVDNDGVVDAVANYEAEEIGKADTYVSEDSEVNSEDWEEYYPGYSDEYAEVEYSDYSQSEFNSESEEDLSDDDDDDNDFDDDDPLNAELEEPDPIPDEYQNSNYNIVDEPENDSDDWQQQTYEDSCSVVAEQSILNELTGENFSEDELRQEAIDNGWLTPGGGTTIDSVGNLLEAHGIDVEQKTGCSFEDITEQLEQGQNVMVALDSDEIWNPGGSDEDDLSSSDQGIPEQGANHVVQVIGIDNSDPDNPMVIINDPGHPEGQGMAVSADQFMDAWEDSNQYMVHTTGNTVQENESADLDFGGRDIGLLGDYYDYDDPVEYSTSLGDYYANYSDSCAYQGYGEEASAYAGYATGAYDDASWHAEHGY